MNADFLESEEHEEEDEEVVGEEEHEDDDGYDEDENDEGDSEEQMEEQIAAEPEDEETDASLPDSEESDSESRKKSRRKKTTHSATKKKAGNKVETRSLAELLTKAQDAGISKLNRIHAVSLLSSHMSQALAVATEKKCFEQANGVLYAFRVLLFNAASSQTQAPMPSSERKTSSQRQELIRQAESQFASEAKNKKSYCERCKSDQEHMQFSKVSRGIDEDMTNDFICVKCGLKTTTQ